MVLLCDRSIFPKIFVGIDSIIDRGSSVYKRNRGRVISFRIFRVELGLNAISRWRRMNYLFVRDLSRKKFTINDTPRCLLATSLKPSLGSTIRRRVHERYRSHILIVRRTRDYENGSREKKRRWRKEGKKTRQNVSDITSRLKLWTARESLFFT